MSAKSPSDQCPQKHTVTVRDYRQTGKHWCMCTYWNEESWFETKGEMREFLEVKTKFKCFRFCACAIWLFIKGVTIMFWVFLYQSQGIYLTHTQDNVCLHALASPDDTAAKKDGCTFTFYSLISLRGTWLGRWGIGVLLKGTLMGFKAECVVMGQTLQPPVCPSTCSLTALKWKFVFDSQMNWVFFDTRA